MSALAEHLVAQWHPTKNGDLTPTGISPGTSRRVWWLGDCGHEWDDSVRGRAITGNGCPFCSNHRVLTGFNDFEVLYPDLAAEWHSALNGDRRPSMFSKSAKETVWWLCAKGHSWECVLKDRVSLRKGIEVIRGCPYCSNRKVLYEFNDLATCFPDIAAEWHLTLNKEITPNEVTFSSSASFYWLGLNCGHTFQQPVGARTGRNTGCPYCAGILLLAGFNDLASMSPEICKEWHPTKNDELQPSQVMNGSNKKVWWLGACCGHEWESSVAKRSKHSQGCPYCSGKRGALTGVNDIATKRPDLVLEWHPTKNGNLSPEVVSVSAHVEIWWQCVAGHEWKAPAYSRVSNNCGVCSGGKPTSKGENEIAMFLKTLGLTVIQNDRQLVGKELDIYLPEKKVAIEYNGLYWHSEAAGKASTYHHDKWKLCKDNGIQLIQIWEDEWNFKREIVKQLLTSKVGLSNVPKVFARKTTVSLIEKNQAEKFLAAHHIQGYASGSYYLGLFEKTSDGLVAVLVLKKEKSEEVTLNIIRYATSNQVIGGFTKMLSFAEKILKPDSFITFSDNCVSNGNLYESNGFISDKSLPPDYMYVIGKQRKHKFGYRINKFKSDPSLLWEEGLTERELANLNGLKRIWDAGKIRWKKECDTSYSDNLPN